MKKSPYRKQAVEFIPVESLGLSPDAIEDISGSSGITFGDARHSLFAASKILGEIKFTNPADRACLQAVSDACGPDTLIDLSTRPS